MTIDELIEKLPPINKIPNARGKIREMNTTLKHKLVVLDDDPTGCQTVHDVKLLLDWESSRVKRIWKDYDVFFLLTNTRAYSEEIAVLINTEIAEMLKKQVDLSTLKILSRSDSTLRGHFYGEVKTLADVLGPFDGIIVIPYFKEGRRLTVFDTHYVLQKGELVGVNRTEYSRDPIFGFKNAHLPSWIEEKSRGLWKKEEVLTISIEDIRCGGPQHIKDCLLSVKDSRPVVVNALCDEDLEIFALGLIQAEEKGKRFLYRTAASFVKIRAGIQEKELFSPPKCYQGLIVVGSYVQLSTDQLENLLSRFCVERVEIKVSKVLSDSNQSYLQEVASYIDNVLSQHRSIVVYTERGYALCGNVQAKLQGAQKISSFLATLVSILRESPDFIIAKGGITSYDLAKRGLQVKEATVLGQVSPGVPIWELGEESKYPHLLYVVFPGNVGDETTLSNIFNEFIS